MHNLVFCEQFSVFSGETSQSSFQSSVVSNQWITCVKTVFTDGYKAVGSYAQFPHSLYTFFTAQRLIPMFDRSARGVVRARRTDLYTALATHLTPIKRLLLTVSTVPITTTTIYIIRRGATQ